MRGSASAATSRRRLPQELDTLARAAAHVHLAHMGIAPTHDTRHPLIALALPGFYRVGLVPRLVELSILL